jgi:DNA repair photolyase
MMRHGSNLDPPNRFERVHREADWEHLAWDNEYLAEVASRKIQYLTDESQSIVSENDSPDIPFRYSVNPYRGCAHACPYCYARNTHEYLGMNAGLDFETKIIVKKDAPELLKKHLARDDYQPDTIVFSGVTDCYQPAERQFQLTRQCLKLASECRQPIGIITKNALVTRDLDILQPMAGANLVHVNLSITTLDPELSRIMEPRASTPTARLRAVKMLTDAGVPVRVMVAPLIPGLNDHEAPAIMQAAKEAGALDARYILLRLPLTVEPVFQEWLSRTQPAKAEKIQSLIKLTRGGKLNESAWGQRMTGSGNMAEYLRSMFRLFRKKYGFGDLPKLDVSQFVPPVLPGGQLKLF